MSTEKILKTIYYDPNHPAGFSSAEKLFRAALLKRKTITRKEVNQFLQSQMTYSIHHPVKMKFKRRKTFAKYLDHIWQADLIDFQKHARINKGFRYVLTVIDILSRYAYAIPVKNKTGKSMVSAFTHIFSKNKRVPKKLQTDNGGEFYNGTFKSFLKQKHIIHYSSFSDTKAALVERFNRTLKNKIYKYFTFHDTKKYIEVLPQIVNSYNNTVHSAHGLAPANVTKRNQKKIWKILYENHLNKPQRTPKFNVGDLVRISKTRKQFQKGYEERYTREIFVIDKVKFTKPPTYEIKDNNNEKIIGSFYEQELIKIRL